MSTGMRERSFWVGVAFGFAGVVLYGVDRMAGHQLGTNDLLWHLLPFGLAGGCMMPKYWAGLMATAANVVNQVLGKWRAMP